MRQPEEIEEDLMEMAATTDEVVKLERIVAWCATHPDEVPIALHLMLGKASKKSD